MKGLKDLKDLNGFPKLKLKLRTKMLCGFLVIALLSGVIGVMGVINITTLSNSHERLVAEVVVPMEDVSEIKDSFRRLQVSIRDAVLADTPELREQKLMDVKFRMADMNNFLSNIENDFSTGATADGSSDGNSPTGAESGRDISGEQNDYEAYGENLRKISPIVDRIAAEIERGNVEGAIAMLDPESEEGKAFSAMQNAITMLSVLKMRYADDMVKNNEEQSEKVITGMMILAAVALVLSILIGLSISFLISRPINKLVVAADKLAVGDVDVELDLTNSTYEIKELMASFQKIVESVEGQSEAAKSIAAGDLSIEIAPRSDKDVLALCMISVVDTLKNLGVELDNMSTAASEGRWDVRGDKDKFDGQYKNIVQGFNGTFEEVVSKMFLYEEIIDSVPFPVSVTDMDRKWIFINKALEETLGRKRDEVIGESCADRNASICNTEDCGIECLQRGINETAFGEDDKHYMVTTEYLYNAEGEKIGYIELMQDDTLLFEADQYQEKETEHLVENLKLLAQGNLDLDCSVSEGNEYTELEHRTFTTLNENLKQATDNLTAMVKEISYVLSEIADGNLDVDIEVDYQGDFVEIKNSLNHILKSLSEMMGDINQSAEQVSTGSRQVSDGSQSLSQGSTEQASSIEELTASITEIAAQTKQNATNANKANELSATTRDKAAMGNEQMKEMLSSMEGINESSANISKIIKVIDDIAFQTNILALNAAVEAARAGQHGKGFAVVAEEVRNLAARSAKAAQQTTDLIEGSVNKVKAGTKIANETASALEVIVEEAGMAADLVSEIANASNEQASGIAQINKGIEQVSQVVQSNSATAEESAAASEELSGQAELLKEMVGKFKLKRPENMPAAPVMIEPEVLDQRNEGEEVPGNSPPPKPRIILNDEEFDKY